LEKCAKFPEMFGCGGLNQYVKDEQHMSLSQVVSSRSRGPHPGAAAVPRGGVGGGKVEMTNDVHLGGRRNLWKMPLDSIR